MRVDNDVQAARDFVTGLVRELARLEKTTPALGFDEAMASLDLEHPPAELDCLAMLLRICQDDVSETGGWSPETYPLGEQRLRQLILGQFLDFAAQQFTTLSHAYLQEAGIDLDTMAMAVPSG